MASTWYLNRGARAEGPFSEAKVVAQIGAGQIGPEWWAARQGDPSWRPLAAHPAFAQALEALHSAPRARRREAPTLVGARAPSADRDGPEVVHSLAGGPPPEILAVPIPGEVPLGRRLRRFAIGLGVLAVSALVVGGVTTLVLYEPPAEPLTLVVEEAVVEDVDHRAVGELVEEQVRVRVRTEPGARVRVSSGPEAIAGADGVASAVYPFGRTREPTLEVPVRAELSLEGERAREGRVQLTVERPTRLRLRGGVAECSTRPCALGVEADGALTVSGVGPNDTVTLGAATARGGVPDATDELLGAMAPTALFASEDYTVSLPLRFALEDGTVFEGEYPAGSWTLKKALFDRFVTVDEGAVEVPQEARGSAILWIGGVGRGRAESAMTLVGEAESVGAIGRVALVEARPRRRSCGRYGSGQAARTVVVEQRDAFVQVYDRRRGRRQRTRTVSAPRPACPATVTLEPGEGDYVAATSEPEPGAVASWLRRL